VGRFLRAASLDELPQLFNVLNGTMSMVGPRPALPEEVARFDSDLHARHRVPPGITGLWQIEARDNPSFFAYRQLDLFYVENWSFALDLVVIAATVPCLLARAVRSAFRSAGPQTVTAIPLPSVAWMAPPARIRTKDGVLMGTTATSAARP
jgi:lipopolysaccharide/colanic/teichoic acid biosynthesis glycosyltransferase